MKPIVAVLFVALMLAGIAGCGSSESSGEAKVHADRPRTAGNLDLGDRLPDFTLSDYDGNAIKLSDKIDGAHYVAVIWHSPACPCAHNCATAIAKQITAEAYPDLTIVGVTSDKMIDVDWFRADMKKQTAEKVVTFPVLLDRDQAVMKSYGAKRTPTVWLADKKGRIRYWGAPENTLDSEDKEYDFLFKKALDDLRAGREVKVPRFEPLGCLIN